VPNLAGMTTGDAALSGTVHGLPVTVYDRARRRPRLGDPVQTVWTVHLPVALPYLSSTYFTYLRLADHAAGADRAGRAGQRPADPGGADLEGVLLGMLAPQVGDDPRRHTADPDFARTLATPQIRSAATANGTPRFWIEGRYLYAVEERPKAPAIGAYAERLALIAGRLPWADLQRYAQPERVR
jgi:hypothetical protein